MPNIKRVLIENCCYHLITRGNQKQKVFNNREDYLTYLAFLKRFKRKYNFYVYAYCLMPNHVHIVGEIKTISFLSNFMHNLSWSYSTYFNNKYDKVGHLWQGRFKSKIINKDKYLIDCLSYVESNPLRSNLVQSMLDFPWSSYRARILGEEDGIFNELGTANILQKGQLSD